MPNYQHINEDSPVYDVMNHPAFSDWGRLIFPWDEKRRYSADMTMRDMPDLHLWHTGMDSKVMVDGVNRMIDDINEGKKVFYDIYTDEEKDKDPGKKNTGLFFLRGRPGAPFAVICPGGGFYYVGSLHEGFPLAMAINDLGYNAFVLKYRVNQWETIASLDLIRAVNFIRENKDELDVKKDDYSLWGGSAGARMCSNVSYGEGGIRRDKGLLRPASSVIAYTYFAGNPDFEKDDPPAYFIMGKNDAIVPWREVDKRARRMKRAGIPVESHILDNLKHGFSLGEGTPAQGWVKDAVKFWERNMTDKL